MFDQNFAVRIEFGNSPDQEQDSRPDNALISFQRIQGIPFDVAVFFDFGLETT